MGAGGGYVTACPGQVQSGFCSGFFRVAALCAMCCLTIIPLQACSQSPEPNPDTVQGTGELNKGGRQPGDLPLSEVAPNVVVLGTSPGFKNQPARSSQPLANADET